MVSLSCFRNRSASPGKLDASCQHFPSEPRCIIEPEVLATEHEHHHLICTGPNRLFFFINFSEPELLGWAGGLAISPNEGNEQPKPREPKTKTINNKKTRAEEANRGSQHSGTVDRY